MKFVKEYLSPQRACSCGNPIRRYKSEHGRYLGNRKHAEKVLKSYNACVDAYNIKPCGYFRVYLEGYTSEVRLMLETLGAEEHRLHTLCTN